MAEMTYKIPLSFIETDNLESYFAKMALKGYRLKKVCEAKRSGTFTEIAPYPYHFSVGVYKRRLTEEERETKEFRNFCQEWEDRGWDSYGFMGNLASYAFNCTA